MAKRYTIKTSFTSTPEIQGNLEAASEEIQYPDLTDYPGVYRIRSAQTRRSIQEKN